MPDYQLRDDTDHAKRVFQTAMAILLPLMVFCILMFVLNAPIWLLVLMAVVYLPLAILHLHRVAFTGVCPGCKTRIRFTPMQDRYTRGDSYTYTCDQCQTVWNTRLFPRGD